MRTNQLTRGTVRIAPDFCSLIFDCSLIRYCYACVGVEREEWAMFDEGEKRFNLTRRGLWGFLSRLRVLWGRLESRARV